VLVKCRGVLVDAVECSWGGRGVLAASISLVAAGVGAGRNGREIICRKIPGCWTGSLSCVLDVLRRGPFEPAGGECSAGRAFEPLGVPMTLRVHFTAQDLARTTVVGEPDPLWELTLSLSLLQHRQVAERYRPWLARTRARLTKDRLWARARLLASLVPARGDSPDFLTPTAGADFRSGMEKVCTTPPERVGKEIAHCFRGRPTSPWVRALARGDHAARRELEEALVAYHDSALAPCLNEIGERVQTDRARRGRDLLDGGVDRFLRALPPPMSWTPPVLSARYPVDRDLHLRGRGLTLVPSHFCCRTPITLVDPRLPPVLVYPAGDGDDAAKAAPRPGQQQALGALLGHTRAQMLCALSCPASTSELARRTGTSIGTASKHATVLREAGLISSARRGTKMLHTLTRVGRALLDEVPTG
jgi:DNA-binding transcriptional ArsR family regulator